MPIAQTATNSFVAESWQGTHNFGPSGADTFKIALYTGNATLNADTTAYSATNEVSGTGYVAGGNTLTINSNPTASSDGAFVSFANSVWTGTFTARGALIYNATKSNKAVAVLDFGADKTAVTGLTVQFPTPGATTAVLRIKRDT